MQTYHNLKAKMKGQTPSNWSPALKPKDATKVAIEPLGTGLSEIPRPHQDPQRVNQTIYQSYEWYTPSWSTPVTALDTTTAASSIVEPSANGSSITNPTLQPRTRSTHYSVISSLLPSLAALGITSVWLPPGCKGSNPQDNGYGIYDLYDLGEFDTKGSRATKWGSKEELVALGQKAKELGVGLLWDAVLNHRAAADGKEKARAVTVDSRDRTVETSPPKDIVSWSRFTYPVRKNQYSDMTYTWQHFSGIDWDDQTHRKAIYKFVSDSSSIIKPGWSPTVDPELGNYDYLMFADLDYSQPDVQRDVLHWTTWLPTQIPGLTGLRLDAIKHYDARFQYRLLHHLRTHEVTKDWLVVGEYWRADSQFLAQHIDRFEGHMSLFDVKLMYNFADFSFGRIIDLREIFRGSLVELRPENAVTFTTNHDTQPTQSLSSPVSPWFFPHAHALILLRASGTPCIFHGDIHGVQGPQPCPPASGSLLPRLVLCRKLYAYGVQHDFFAGRDLIAWSREGCHESNSGSDGNSGSGSIDNGVGGGIDSRSTGLAVICNTAWSWQEIKVYVGTRHRGETWTDVLGWSWERVVIDSEGWGLFRVAARLVGVFVRWDAVGRERVDELVWPAV